MPHMKIREPAMWQLLAPLQSWKSLKSTAEVTEVFESWSVAQSFWMDQVTTDHGGMNIPWFLSGLLNVFDTSQTSKKPQIAWHWSLIQKMPTAWFAAVGEHLWEKRARDGGHKPSGWQGLRGYWRCGVRFSMGMEPQGRIGRNTVAKMAKFHVLKHWMTIPKWCWTKLTWTVLVYIGFMFIEKIANWMGSQPRCCVAWWPELNFEDKTWVSDLPNQLIQLPVRYNLQVWMIDIDTDLIDRPMRLN